MIAPTPRTFLALAASLLLGACDGEPAASPDGGAAGDGPTLPDGSVAQDYDDPGDFDRLGCTPGSLDGLAPDGIWHADVTLDGIGSFPAVLRLDPTPPLGRVNGRDTDDVRRSPDDLFVRIHYTLADGSERLRAFDACHLEPDGRLAGKVAYCSSGRGCFPGTFVAGRVERLPGPEASGGLTVLGEHAGDPAAPWTGGLAVNVRVLDGTAYVARYDDGLRIVDVADPAAMRDLGHAPVARPEANEIYNDVKLVEASGRRYALVASNRRGVVAIDVTDPAAPVEVSTFPAPPRGKDRINVHTLFTETLGGTTRAYLADTTLIGLQIWDVTDPTAPAALGTYVHPDVATDYSAYLHDLFVENGRAYLNYWGLGLVVVDTLADPANPTLVGQFKDYERRTNHSNWVTQLSSGAKISVVGDEDFGAHVRTVDVDPASPTFMKQLGEWQTRPEVSVHNIMAAGDRAYIAWYHDGIRILDLTNPAAPAQAAHLDTWPGYSASDRRYGSSFYEGAIGLDLDLAAGRIYVADSHRGLIVVGIAP